VNSEGTHSTACWHGIWPGGFCGVWPKAAGMRPVACGAHGPPPAPMPRSRASPGSDARHWSPDVILGFAEYALFFPIYICLSLSLSLLFRPSLLYDSQFNISIRTRLISTQHRNLDFAKQTIRFRLFIVDVLPTIVKSTWYMEFVLKWALALDWVCVSSD
jgi:hypothetical protein